MLGFAEQLEFLKTIDPGQIQEASGRVKEDVIDTFTRAAKATCDFYLQYGSCADGVCYWDTGAPHLHRLGDYRSRPADPYNAHEPVDASAAAIAAQGLIRLGRALSPSDTSYEKAGLTLARTLFGEPYLATDQDHQGLLLHSVYHRPRGWDAIPPGRAVPCGESSMWGDYHLLELALLVQRLAEPRATALTFFDPP
jgi:hypothetical protein